MYEMKAHRWGIEKLKDEAGVARDSELADVLGFSTSTISRIKAGGNVPGRFIASVNAVFGECPEIYYMVKIETTGEVAA